MNLLIATGICVLAIIVMVALLKVVFNLIVAAVGIAIAVAVYFLAEKLVGRGR